MKKKKKREKKKLFGHNPPSFLVLSLNVLHTSLVKLVSHILNTCSLFLFYAFTCKAMPTTNMLCFTALNLSLLKSTNILPSSPKI